MGFWRNLFPPKLVPVEEWEFVFSPQPDITILELADIVSRLPQFSHVPADKLVHSRHFVKRPVKVLKYK